MARYLISGARVFDGTGDPPSPAEVLVEDNRIALVAGQVPVSLRAGAEVIDGSGSVLMPGLIDGHTHLGFGSTVEHLSSRLENEEAKTLLIAHNARVMLDHGFTSAYSGGNRLPRAEVAARDAIAEGWLPGPRLRACSFEGSVGMVSPGHYDFPGIESRESNPAAMRQFVNQMADLGVDVVKFSLSGESAVDERTSRVQQFTEEEVAAAGETARERGVWLTAHAHSAQAIQMAVRHGFRAIYHVSFADDATIDALAEARDRIFVAPTPGILYAHLHDETHPPTEGMETQVTIDSVRRVAPELFKRGVRLLIGGDYGFSFNPVGNNARDLQLFVDWFGLSAAEALRCATQFGGQVMDRGHELGLVQEGYLADLLLVDGDPTLDITVLRDPARLALIMQDGRVHKVDASRLASPVGR